MRRDKPKSSITLKSPSKKTIEVKEVISVEHVVRLFKEVDEFLSPDNHMRLSVEYDEEELNDIKTMINEHFEDRHFFELFKSPWGRGFIMGCLSLSNLNKAIEKGEVL